jgi:hypothetical protein
MKIGHQLWQTLKTLGRHLMRDHTGDTISVTLTDFDESGMSCDTVYTLTDTISSVTTMDNGITIDTSAYDNLFTDDSITLTLNDPVEFEDHMPDVAKIEDMCNDYPALAQAYEKFKTMYALVHQDWKGRQEDDQFPF